MSRPEYEIDDLDREILRALQADARTAFLEIGRQLSVSGGTVHQRVDKMRAAGVIQGYKVELNPERLGLGVSVLIGIHLTSAREVPTVLERLEALEEVLEVYYTSGTYALFLKVRVRDISAYRHFLIEQLQEIPEIRTTESFICLDQPIDREIRV